MSVDPIKIKNMLLTSAQTILNHIPELTKLDCDLGDGDHGTTMEKIAKTIHSQVNHAFHVGYLIYRPHINADILPVRRAYKPFRQNMDIAGILRYLE